MGNTERAISGQEGEEEDEENKAKRGESAGVGIDGYVESMIADCSLSLNMRAFTSNLSKLQRTKHSPRSRYRSMPFELGRSVDLIQIRQNSETAKKIE